MIIFSGTLERGLLSSSLLASNLLLHYLVVTSLDILRLEPSLSLLILVSASSGVAHVAEGRVTLTAVALESA